MVRACGRARAAVTASSPATTPKAPSNRPPSGTVSRWDPVQTSGSSGKLPGTRPTRLPTASTATLSPASAIQPDTRSWARCSARLSPGRLAGPPPIENSVSSRSRTRLTAVALMASAMGSPGNEQHLPDMLLPVQVAVRLGGPAHRERHVYRDLDYPAPDEVHGRAELVGRRDPEADDAPAVLEQLDHVERDDLAGVRPAGDQGPVIAQHLEVRAELR